MRRAILISALCLLPFAVLAQEPPPATPAAPTAADPEFAKAVFFGKKFFDLREYASAYEQYAKADAIRPDQPGVLYNMAVVLAKAGRYSESQVKVDRYLQLFPSGAEQPLISKLQLELEFQRELQKKRQLEQEYAELFTRGAFQYGRNDLAAALALYQQAEQQRPTDPAAIFNQAMVYERQGDYAKAVERYKRYAELESDADAKNAASQTILALENELEDMRTKVVCTFCGHKLPASSTWCHRCWHGPYLTTQPLWSSRPCVDGATVTRSTFYSDDRFARNDSLPCMTQGGTMLQAIRYAPAKQRAIQDARKAEGWTYAGDIIQGWSDRAGNQIRYTQGSQYLERIAGLTGGEILTYVAHEGAPGVWLLDREDLIIDGQKYTNRYTFDSNGRVQQQQVDYQNTTACNHLVSITADYSYQNDVLTTVKLRGGYEGTAAEGAPKTEWQAAVAYSYDDQARVTKEELAVTSYSKVYVNRPHGALRDEVSKVYPTMKAKRPLDSILRTGDVCATAGTQLLANPIDLRALYAMSPNLAMILPNGVTKATVAFTYPDSYAVR